MDNQTAISRKTFFKKRTSSKSNRCQKNLRLLSLFSGCGGMDLGFEGYFDVHNSCINLAIHPDWIIGERVNGNWQRLAPTKFKTVFANDIRPGAQKAWTLFFKKNFDLDGSLFHLESIVDRVKRYWDGEKNTFPEKIDVVTGGFPCQDFSVAGKRKGFKSHKGHTGNALENPTEENRGKLYMWMREVIDIVRPKVFFAENVKGLISLGDAKNVIQNDFQNIGENGYLVTPGCILNAAEYGIPQSRERVFFIGFRKDALKPEALKAMSEEIIPDQYCPFPIKTHSSNGEGASNLAPFVTLKKIFKDLKEPEKTKDIDQKIYSKAKWYGNHCQGNKEISLDKIGPTIRAEHHGNIEFRRLSKKHGGKISKELDNGLMERRLTIRECCRIQTFPDSYGFLGSQRGDGVSASEAYKLIGNAVPPLLAYHLAKRLEKIWPIVFQ